MSKEERTKRVLRRHSATSAGSREGAMAGSPVEAVFDGMIWSSSSTASVVYQSPTLFPQSVLGAENVGLQWRSRAGSELRSEGTYACSVTLARTSGRPQHTLPACPSATALPCLAFARSTSTHVSGSSTLALASRTPSLSRSRHRRRTLPP